MLAIAPKEIFMRKLRNTAQYIFSLILALLFLTSGLVMPGYSRSQHHHSAALNAETSWTSINAGLTNLGISAMAINPAQPATIYVGTSTGVFKTTDGGASWSNTGLSRNSVHALAIDFTNPNIVHVGVSNGGECRFNFPLFRSTDGGASWSNHSSPADCDISLIVTDPTSPNVLYAGSETQYIGTGSTILWKSTDSGATWSTVWFGNPGLASYGLVVDPTNSQTLYAPGDLYANMNVVDSGLFKSTDGGASWNATGLTNTNVYTMAINPLNSNILYAGTIDYGVANTPFRGVLKSTDSGASWFAINNGLSDLLSAHSAITAIVVDPANPNIVYAASSGSGVFRSNDGGLCGYL
ncbi:MAG: hypothetical protein AUG51_11340 [Acidobacteria bacterium 13_1_20CM_3_53_8]|nr:MAG: hypothetical protein AUG51_11340 [Acidobacteria bacterium 13_1_20CM_3_53_8]